MTVVGGKLKMVSYTKNEQNPQEMFFFVKTGNKMLKLMVKMQQKGRVAKFGLKKIS